MRRHKQLISRRANRGFTLAEVLIAAVIAAVIAGGTMMAFIVANNMMRTRTNPAHAEAAAYGQQTAENFRNMISCGSTWFRCPDTDQDPLTYTPLAACCTAAGQDPATTCLRCSRKPADGTYLDGMPTTWTNDPIPIVAELRDPGTESITTLGGVERCYQVVPRVNCVAGAGVPDCYELQVRVCWDNDVNCPCL